MSEAVAPPTRSEIENLEARQSKADSRLSRVEGQIESLVSTVADLASTVSESHRESRENFKMVYSKIDSIRDLFAASRSVAWGPMLSALGLGAGFVALIVSPIRGRTESNEAELKGTSHILREHDRMLGAFEATLRHHEQQLREKE